MNLDELIKSEDKKHAAKLKKLRAQAAKEEQDILLRVARLLERFAQYRDQAEKDIEGDRNDRSKRAQEAWANKQQDGTNDAAAPAGDGGGY